MKFLFALVFAGLAGCSTVYEGKYDFRDHWREAQVIKVVDFSALPRKEDLNCPARASRIDLGDRVAVLSYRQFRRTRTAVRPLLKDTNVLPGALVYVNVSHCDWAIVPAR